MVHNAFENDHYFLNKNKLNETQNKYQQKITDERLLKSIDYLNNITFKNLKDNQEAKKKQKQNIDIQRKNFINKLFKQNKCDKEYLNKNYDLLLKKEKKVREIDSSDLIDNLINEDSQKRERKEAQCTKHLHQIQQLKILNEKLEQELDTYKRVNQQQKLALDQLEEKQSQMV